AAERGTANRDAGRVDVAPGEQVVDAIADRNLVVRPRDDLMSPQRSALPGTADHEHRDAALQAAVPLLEPHLVLDRIEPTHGDQTGLRAGIERCANEIGVERLGAFVGNLQHLSGRVELSEEAVAATLHVRERLQPPRIVREQPEFRLAIIFASPQPTIHRGANAALGQLLVAALTIEIGDALPLAMPAFLVAGDHPARGQEAFGARAAAFLRLPERAPELIAHPRMLRPVVPAERLVMRIGTIRNLVDQQFLGQAFAPGAGSTSGY